MRLGRVLQIGQTWRERATGRLWAVRQVHRPDCTLLLRDGRDERPLRFAELRADYTWTAPEALRVVA